MHTLLQAQEPPKQKRSPHITVPDKNVTVQYMVPLLTNPGSTTDESWTGDVHANSSLNTSVSTSEVFFNPRQQKVLVQVRFYM